MKTSWIIFITIAILKLTIPNKDPLGKIILVHEKNDK